jgi:hypothetical protein
MDEEFQEAAKAAENSSKIISAKFIQDQNIWPNKSNKEGNRVASK